MVYEMRVYTLQPGKVPAFQEPPVGAKAAKVSGDFGSEEAPFR